MQNNVVVINSNNTSGTLQGVAEAFFEKFSLGGLKALSQAAGSVFKQFIINAAKQVVVEGSEEFFTELTNVVTDIAVMGSKSEVVQYFDNYLQENPEMGR